MPSKHRHAVQLGSSGRQIVEIPCACCDELEADNQRLRAALTEIMAMSEPAGYGERSKSQIRDVARRALDRGNGGA